ncbi:MAG: hypothetical protein V1855_01725 [bacterium]
MTEGLLAAQEALEYNTLVFIKNVQYNKVVWTHAESRDINNNTGAVGNTGSGRSKHRYNRVARPDNHHELLVGVASPASDKREKNGGQFYILQSAVDPKKTGPISYGEAFKILSPISSAGWRHEAGLQKPARVLWAHYPSRLNDIFGEIIVSFPEFLEKNDIEVASHFAFEDPNGKTGTVVSDTPVRIKSLSEAYGGKLLGKYLWESPVSRWGGGFHELLLSSFTDAPAAQAASSFIVSEITIPDKVPAEAWSALSQLIKNTAYNFIDFGKYSPGESEFIYDPKVFGRGSFNIDEKWNLGQKGKGWIKFKAKAKDDIHVVFSAVLHENPVSISTGVTGADYRVIIGGWGNKRCSVRKSSGPGVPVKDNFVIDIDKGGDPEAVVSSDKEEDYWFKVDMGEISYGKGTEVGTNPLFTWKDPEPLNFVRYIGLGGWASIVEFKDIQTSESIVDTPEELEASKKTIVDDQASLDAEQVAIKELEKTFKADEKTLDNVDKKLDTAREKLEKQGLVSAEFKQPVKTKKKLNIKKLSKKKWAKTEIDKMGQKAWQDLTADQKRDSLKMWKPAKKEKKVGAPTKVKKAKKTKKVAKKKTGKKKASATAKVKKVKKAKTGAKKKTGKKKKKTKKTAKLKTAKKVEEMPK